MRMRTGLSHCCSCCGNVLQTAPRPKPAQPRKTSTIRSEITHRTARKVQAPSGVRAASERGAGGCHSLDEIWMLGRK